MATQRTSSGDGRNRAARFRRPEGDASSTGFTVWLTGLSGAGKTAIARALRDRLAVYRWPVEVLDSDDVRPVLSSELGYSPLARAEHTRRIGYVARLLSRNGIAVIVAAMSPVAAARDAVRRSHESPFIEVHVDCPVDVLLTRDPKGLYEQAARGKLDDLTGLPQAHSYEVTIGAEITLNTATTSLDDCIARICEYLVSHALVTAAPSKHSLT